MEEEKRKAYSEVVEILKLIDDEKRIEKIPFEVIELIKKNADPTYKPDIKKEVPLEDQNLRNETYSIMAWIANKYWDEKIEEEPVENNIEVEEIKENNNINTIIEPQESARLDGGIYNDIEPEILDGTLLPAVIEEKWYVRIKEKVIKLLKILFKIGNRKEEVSDGSQTK